MKLTILALALSAHAQSVYFANPVGEDFAVRHDPSGPSSRKYVAPAGSSKVEPGTTPAQDVTLTYATVDALAAACGASRLDGGMHFTGAVQAGADLCKGIGTAGFEYASDLIGGEW